MLDLKTILVPTDLSPSAHRAAEAAGGLAQRYDARLHVLYVTPLRRRDPFLVYAQSALGEAGAEVRAEAATLERMERAVRAQADLDAAVEWVHREAIDVSLSIVEYAQEAKAGLIVIGTHGHRSLDHALGGTAGAVLRQAPCSVMTVREADGAPLPPLRPVQHLLVPVDFSEQSSGAVEAARGLAAHYEARISLLFVAEERTVPFFGDTGLPSLTRLRLDPEILSHAEEALGKLYEEAGGARGEAACLVRTGHPAHEILAVAKAEAADLIVLSSHGATAHRRFTLGSVAERVARQAACPVLTLKGLA